MADLSAVDPRQRPVASRKTTEKLEELHITSLVVHSAPKRVGCVSQAIASIPGAMIHAASPAGKLVVTLEASTADEMISKVADIQRADGVLSAALVYQCVDSLETMNEEIPDADH